MFFSSSRTVQCELCQRRIRIAYWALVRHSVRHCLGVYSCANLVWFSTLQLVSSAVCLVALIGLGMPADDAVTVTVGGYGIAVLYGCASLAIHLVARRRRDGHTGTPTPSGDPR